MNVSTWTCDQAKPQLKLGRVLPDRKFDLTKKRDFTRVNDKLNKKFWSASTSWT